MMARQTYLNAQQAKQLGFVDEITEKPVAGRALAMQESLPYGVVVALSGAAPGGEHSETTGENPVSQSQPVAATLQEIKAAFPQAKAEFVIRCLEKSMPLASVAEAAVAEMMKENEELKAQVAAMKEEMAKGQAVEHGDEKEDEEMMAKAEQAQAKSRGVQPVAKAKTNSGPSARVRWDSAIAEALKQAGGNKVKAAAIANRQNPGLRAELVAEANAAR